MASMSFLIVICVFLVYYLALLISERKFMSEPSEILEKFLAVVLIYAGISLIYFAIIGNPLLAESAEEYSVYIFIIGFIAVFWAIPNLLSEFWFFKKFLKSREKLEKKRKLVRPRKKLK